MQLHQLSPKTKQKKEKRVGRGGKRGTYSGRGLKGQKARAGHRIRPAERDLLKKIPKLRGYKFNPFRQAPAVVNLGELEKRFKEGETVSPETLLHRGLIGKMKGRLPKVKVLGNGVLKKRLIFRNVVFSTRAAKKLKTENEKVKAKIES